MCLSIHWAVLQGANLERINLKGANLSNTVLRDCMLLQTNLEGVNLDGTGLDRKELYAQMARQEYLRRCEQQNKAEERTEEKEQGATE